MKRPIVLLFMMMVGVAVFAQVSMIAHRGASYDAPENTLASVREAWRQGADAVEIDIWETRDGKIVLLHDRSTKRTTGTDLLVDKTRWDVIKTLDAGSFKDSAKYVGERIPLLEDALKEIPQGKKLVVEIKCDASVVRKLRRVVRKSGKADQVVFIAFNWEAISKTAKFFPKNDCYWLSGQKEGLEARIGAVSAAGLKGVDLHWSLIDEALMILCREHQLDVIAWTVDKAEEAMRLSGLGVGGITTNRPGWLKNQLAK